MPASGFGANAPPRERRRRRKPLGGGSADRAGGACARRPRTAFPAGDCSRHRWPGGSHLRRPGRTAHIRGQGESPHRLPQWTESRRRSVLAESCANLARSFVELALLSREDPEELRRLVTIEGLEHLEKARQVSKTGGVIALTAHLGSSELLAAAMVASGLPVTVVSAPGTTPLIEELLGSLRTRGKSRLLPVAPPPAPGSAHCGREGSSPFSTTRTAVARREYSSVLRSPRLHPERPAAHRHANRGAGAAGLRRARGQQRPATRVRMFPRSRSCPRAGTGRRRRAEARGRIAGDRGGDPPGARPLDLGPPALADPAEGRAEAIPLAARTASDPGDAWPRFDPGARRSASLTRRGRRRPRSPFRRPWRRERDRPR